MLLITAKTWRELDDDELIKSLDIGVRVLSDRSFGKITVRVYLGNLWS